MKNKKEKLQKNKLIILGNINKKISKKEYLDIINFYETGIKKRNKVIQR